MALNSKFLKLECTDDDDCKGSNTFCNPDTKKCECKDGFIPDAGTEDCKAVIDGKLCHVVTEIALTNCEKIATKLYTWLLIPNF